MDYSSWVRRPPVRFATDLAPGDVLVKPCFVLKQLSGNDVVLLGSIQS